MFNQGEALERSYLFLLSEKPFRPNTKNPILSETPPPPRHPDKASALAELERELDDFHRSFAEHPGRRTSNPIFGELNYEEQVQLLHKHFGHHLRQFGL
jgi:hypothetical protein